MLRIRKEQWDLFERAEVEKFEDFVHDHVRAYFPREYRAAGEARIRELIRHGRERAGVHGIKFRREVCKYIDLMVMLGRDFDTDPQLPWAAATLQKPRDPAAKVHFLYRAAREHLKGKR